MPSDGPILKRLRRGTDFLNRKLDGLFPRIWLDAWEHALAQGWEPDAPDAYCSRCGSTIHSTAQLPRGCAFCHRHVYPWQSITRLTDYSPVVEEWIHQFKFQKQWSWAPLLGGELASRIALPADRDDTLVCPVPIHFFRRMKRGYNQSQLLAKVVAKKHRLPMLKLLRRVGHRPAQSTLPVSQRQGNVRHVFDVVNIDLTGWNVWLVDDVKTTGATLRQCARLLRHAGAKEVHVMVVAVADPKRADFTVLS